MTTISSLSDYVVRHTNRSKCTCGRCIDSGPDVKLEGHTADVFFFDVSATGDPNPDAPTLTKLISEHKPEFGDDVDLLDGEEHGYMQIGGWIGDQALALTLMGLGALLGLWTIISPIKMLGLKRDDPLAQQMAGAGFITIQRR